MTKKKKRTSLFGKPRTVEPTKTYSSEERQYAKSYEPSHRLKRIIQLIILVLAIGLSYQAMTNRKATREKAAAELAETQKAKELELGSEAYLAFQDANTKAEVAFKDKDYFEAVFQYRQATSYDPNNQLVHEKLIQALNHSCAQGLVMHCESVKEAKERLKMIMNNTN